MKTQTSKITIEAEFSNADELRKVLERIADKYEEGFRDYKKPFVKWLAHLKGREVMVNKQPTVGEMRGHKFEDIDGVRYMVLQSKMNK